MVIHVRPLPPAGGLPTCVFAMAAVNDVRHYSRTAACAAQARRRAEYEIDVRCTVEDRGVTLSMMMVVCAERLRATKVSLGDA